MLFTSRYQWKMTIHNLYIFDRQGVLIFYGEWNRKKQSGMTREEVIFFKNLKFQRILLITFTQEAKLMYGMLYSIRSFVSKISPSDVKEGFQCYRTSKYKLNYYETPSGIKYIMNTDLNSQNIRELMQAINSQVFSSTEVKIKSCYAYITVFFLFS